MRKRVLSIWLSVCMVLTMLPVSVMAEEVSNPAGAGGEIIAFEPLAESEKSVETGTSIENLGLPEELTATVRTAVPADSGTEEKPVQDSGKFLENDASTDPSMATASSAIKESGDDHEEATAPEWEETTVDIPVTWTAEPEYTGNETGDYVFTPVIKGYTVSADLPEINVTVGVQLPMMALRAGTPSTCGDFSVSIDEDGAAPVYDNGVLSFGKAGEYTVSMADGKNSTSDSIEVTVAGVTLNLDGVEINAQDGLKGGQNGANALTVTSGTVNLNVIADSSLTGGTGYTSTYAPTNGGSGISGNVAVTGTETLCVNGGTGGFSEVVLSNSGSGILGDVSISGAVSVIAVGGDNRNTGPGRTGNGITGHVSVSDGATLTAVGGMCQSPMYTGGNGINGNLTVTGNASATLTGGDAILSTPGIALTGTLTATGVTIKGGFTGLTDEITSKDPHLNQFRYIALEPALISDNATFDLCNGTATVTVKPSSDPQWEETGYSFGGWYTAPNGQGTELIGAGDSGVTYYAKWNYNGYTVRTTALDLTGISSSKLYGSTLSGSVYTNAAEGWTWYAAETTVAGERYTANTLVLSGTTVHTIASAALTVPDETTVVLEEDSENTVISGYTSSDSEDVFTYGLYGKGALYMKGGGTLNARAGTAAYTSSDSKKEGSSYGIYSLGNLNFSSCTVNAYGGRGVTTGSDNKSFGIYSDATLIISSGSITGHGGSGRVQSIGIISQGNLEITGGTVTGESGSDDIRQGYGLASLQGNIFISGGSVTGTGSAISGTNTFSVGILALGAVEITDGSVTGIAGDAEASYGIISGFLSVNITGGTITAKNGTAANSAAVAALGDSSYSKLIVGSLEKPAAIANASDGTSLIAASNGEISSKQLVMSGSDAVVVSFSTYGITANAAINGNYIVTVNGSALVSAKSGDTVAIIPTADGGYEVDSISVCKTSDTNTTVTVTGGSFTMPDYAVTVSVIFKRSAPTDAQLLAAAKTAAQNEGYGDMTQEDAPNEEAIKAVLKPVAETAVNNSGITVTINEVSYIPPIAGTSANPMGTDGTYTFTVTVSKGGQSQTTEQISITITATPYTGVTDVQAVDAAKTAAQNAIYGNMTQAAATNKDVIQAALKSTAEKAVNNSNITVTINEVSYIAPVAGTSANPSGTDGSYTFTVTVSKGGQRQTAEQKTIIIMATPYSGGNGGGSGNGSNSGSNTAAQSAKPTESVSGRTENKATVNNEGNANVSLIDKNITDAIADAKAAAAKKSVNASDITAIIHVTTGGKDANSVIVNLPKTTQEQVIDNKIASVQLAIDHPDLTIGINLAAVAEINRQAKADVQLSAIPMDKSRLSGDAKAAIGNRPAYDFKAVSGSGETVTDFGNGSISVELPYTLQNGEAAGNICAVYVDANGKVTYLTDSSYDAKRGTVVFSTSHFSTYGIACKGGVSFTDINEHWAKDDILFAVTRGILTGTSSTTFSPNASMTRGMFVTALGRLANADISAYKKSSFSDVKTDAFYMGYIEWGVKNNILEGIGGGKFDPDGLLTREQMAVMMDRYATAMGFKLPEVHTQNTFADNDKIGTWASPSVKRIQIAGILQGKNNNFYAPQGTATRAEVSAVLRRFVELMIFRDTAQGWVRNDSGDWMFFKEGKALTGWQTLDGKVYCFDSSGCAFADGWKENAKGEWFFLSSDGSAITGWKEIGANGDSKSYYFDTSGVMIADKWLKIDEKWYYFYADGSLARSTIVDGCEIDANGVTYAPVDSSISTDQ